DGDRGEGLRPLDRVPLREVDDVDGGAALLDEALEEVLDRLEGVVEGQRNRALGVGDDGDLPARAPLEVPLEEADVAEGAGHEDELGVRQLEEGDLPRPAA